MTRAFRVSCLVLILAAILLIGMNLERGVSMPQEISKSDMRMVCAKAITYCEDNIGTVMCVRALEACELAGELSK